MANGTGFKVRVTNIEAGPGVTSVPFTRMLQKINPKLKAIMFRDTSDTAKSSPEKLLWTFAVTIDDERDVTAFCATLNNQPVIKGSKVLMNAFIVSPKPEVNKKTPATATAATPAQAPISTQSSVAGTQQTAASAATSAQQTTATAPAVQKPQIPIQQPFTPKPVATDTQPPTITVHVARPIKSGKSMLSYAITGSVTQNDKPMTNIRVALSITGKASLVKAGNGTTSMKDQQGFVTTDEHGVYQFGIKSSDRDMILTLSVSGRSQQACLFYADL